MIKNRYHFKSYYFMNGMNSGRASIHILLVVGSKYVYNCIRSKNVPKFLFEFAIPKIHPQFGTVFLAAIFTAFRSPFHQLSHSLIKPFVVSSLS